ncbi:SICAvar, type I [Plasmodium knowlesi strain H]|uniref:SICAvar, type I n=1 Tax=Plasmodium knowlesi (strain H) TaxID=5851 RepID=A0A1A7VR65_PLAKH|nr:SICAvar, type I [Plasmodium knowlesi strain H]
MKNSTKSFCDRLQCAQQHWELTKTVQQVGGNTDKFWNNYVKDELGNLFNRGTVSNGGTTSNHCNSAPGLDNANKEACKHITAKLELMYQNSKGKHQFSDQIINCLLINAYAKKLNDQAKQKGYCDIEKGLKKAFEVGGKCTASNGSCIECKRDDKWDSCNMAISTSNDSVKEKVKELFNGKHQTKDTGIQQTLDDFNKGKSLCERIQCASKWYNDTQGTAGQEDFWDKNVKALWDELAKKMKDNGGKWNGDCEEVKDGNDNRTATHSEKMACKYLHAGLKHLYTTSSTDDDIFKNNPSLKQAMGCFLLHAYANEMKKRATCLIDAGIEKAFKLGEGLSTRGISCEWEESQFGGCQIDINGKGEKKSAKDKVDAVLEADNANLESMAKQVNNVTKLCDQVQCVTARWLKEKHGSNSATDKWNEMWKKFGEEIPKLSDALQEATSDAKKNDLDKYCNGLTGQNGKPPDKEACLLIATGLRNLYNVNDGTNDAVEASFKRTMQCVLLNAIADKLENGDFPCKDEKKTKEGIDHAFSKSDDIKSKGKGCKDGNDKCFTCERFTKYKDCTIKKNDNALEVKYLKEEIDPILNKVDEDDTSSLSKKSLTKTICNLCDRAQCAMKQWFPDRGKDKGQESDRKEMWEKVQEQVTDLVTSIPDNGGKKAETDDLCNEVECKNGEKDCVSKTTCKLIVKALKEVHKIEENGEDEPPLKVNNRIFKSTMRCVALNAFIHKLKKQAKQGGYACAVQKGVEGAFSKGESKRKDWCGENVKGVGNGDGSCEKCQIGQCITSKIGDDGLWSKVVDMLSNDSTTNNNNNIQQTLSKIKEKVTLCDRLQCLASRVKISKKEDKFWTGQDGAVKKLWDELAGAMNANGGNDQSGNGCDQMDGNGRTPTEPERRACNYLHSGLKQLYQPDTSLSAGNNGILSKDKNPLLRQTVGCFLLKEYAKQLQKDSKCVIEAGLKKAFQNNKSSCGNNASCIECEWDENLENCDLKIGSDNKKLNEKFNELLEQNNNNNLEENLGKINHMNNLCDYIKCAAPKWFNSNKEVKNGATTNKTWCNFWDEGVQPELKKMFDDIAQNGNKNAKNKTDVCNSIGDGNEHSVERKACNHITAGLEYINTITGEANAQNGHQDDDKFFKQSMMCAALNLYADKIKEQTDIVCPIDEKRIEKMFDDWNKQNNPNSSPSPSCKSGVYDCFVCKRDDKILDGCNLLVDKGLIGKSTPSQPKGNCNDNDENKKVQEKMTNLLQTEPKMGETLMNINEMKSSFCTQVQCAIKKKLKSNNGQTLSTGTTQPWKNIEDDAKDVLTKLLEQMTDTTNQAKVADFCKDNNWDNFGHKEKQTNKAACLLFAAGLKHIYSPKKDQFNGPSFGQTMGCLFLKEYAKQLKEMAKEQKEYKVHPKCSVEDGIKHAFEQSAKIMNDTPPCKNNGNSCFVCKQNEDDYKDCLIGSDSVKSKVETIFQDKQNKNHMQQTLENTVCPILLTDLLTPFLPLAPVSIGLSAMAYYLWKYFGPLGKGGPRLRRSPAEIPGPSVQEQVLDHVEEAGSHEYRLVKERKPPSAPTRTKRSGRANRRTIIEIHFEVLDECQKGDTQLNQKDFLELLVQEFMGSEFMEEEQVPKEDVLMDEVLMEGVPMECVPSLFSGFMV